MGISNNYKEYFGVKNLHDVSRTISSHSDSVSNIFRLFNTKIRITTIFQSIVVRWRYTSRNVLESIASNTGKPRIIHRLVRQSSRIEKFSFELDMTRKGMGGIEFGILKDALEDAIIGEMMFKIVGIIDEESV